MSERAASLVGFAAFREKLKYSETPWLELPSHTKFLPITDPVNPPEKQFA